jgi:hypothetical protein
MAGVQIDPIPSCLLRQPATTHTQRSSSSVGPPQPPTPSSHRRKRLLRPGPYLPSTPLVRPRRRLLSPVDASCKRRPRLNTSRACNCHPHPQAKGCQQGPATTTFWRYSVSPHSSSFIDYPGRPQGVR